MIDMEYDDSDEEYNTDREHDSEYQVARAEAYYEDR